MRESTTVAEAATPRMGFLALVAVGLIVGGGLFLAGCPVCSVGEETNCVCDDGSSGTQVCTDDYTWGECVCDGSTAKGGNHSGTLQFSMVDAGKEHACGILKSTNEVRCWGANDEGQTDAPAGEFIDVGAGDGYSCGINEIGNLKCWGDYSFGLVLEEYYGYEGGPYTEVSVGGTTCVINENGKEVCHRTDHRGWTAVGEHRARHSQIAVGESLICSRRESARDEEDDTVTCDMAEYGDKPFSRFPSGKYLDVAAGREHACGITRELQQITCVGNNAEIPDRHVDRAYVDVSAGGDVTCGVEASTYDPYCWGEASSDVTDPPNWKFDNISVGLEFACGLTTSDEVVCWGKNDKGQAEPPTNEDPMMSDMQDTGMSADTGVLADTTPDDTGTPSDTSSPTDTGPKLDTVPQSDGGSQGSDVGAIHVGVGKYHSCAVGTDQKVRCWGLGSKPNQQEQSLLGTDVDQAVPPTNQTFVALSAGFNSTCGIRSNGRLSCWGGVNKSEPVSGMFQQLHIPGGSGCAVRSNGDVACWGLTGPSGTEKFEKVSVSRHGCGVLQGGELKCWGEGSNPDPDVRPILQKDKAVPPSGTYQAVAVTRRKSCAAEAGGGVKCWGVDIADDPVTVSTKEYVQLEGADSSPIVCGVSVAGEVDCWKATDPSSSIGSPPSGTFSEVSVGDHHACAVGKQSGVECWFHLPGQYKGSHFDEGQANVMFP